MHKITKRRFDAIAGYARRPEAVLTGEELGYFETDDSRLLGLLVRDRTDRDFAGMAFGRDARLRFRWTSMTAFSRNPSQAVRELEELMTDLLPKPNGFHHQGDEIGPPVDFFEPLHVNERLHPDFLTLVSSRGFSSAKAVIEVMMRWHEDLDGNFVEQFQSTAFDQRIWELYLFALLIELGYVIDANNAVPDFIVRGLRGKMAIEAVTVGPTRVNGGIVAPPTTETPDKLDAYLNDYMPIKFGSPLYSKLRKEYWKRPQISGLPLVFAIADFSSPESMLHSRPALERYLYGFSFQRNPDPEASVPVVATKIAEHRWGEKVIPSGFFDIPDACNVSAVISTTSGTIAKFNRMGLVTGFGADNILMIRRGTCYDKRIDATTLLGFEAIVNGRSYTESWVEGLNVYHNPNATIPLDEELIPGAAHHHCNDCGEWRTSAPIFQPFESGTEMIDGADIRTALKEFGGQHIRYTKLG